ncbi:dihydroxyacetone kinase subunit DhaK [Nocardioides pyridinolyticus]
MQKFLNAPDTAVTEYLTGLAAAHPEVVAFRTEDRIVTRAAPARPGKVGLISGGGSGCEPLHAGYVGLGMLDASCPGEVFTSPVPAQIMAATEAADHGSGVLFIIKNFGGEVMNFGLAAEIMSRRGIRIEKVLVDDDASFPPGLEARRRGLGATVLAEKIAGAAAERGRSLDEVAALARRVVQSSRTFGVALSSCTPPRLGRPTFELPEGQYEIGVGLGGDRGQERGDLPPADEVADVLLERIVDELDIAEDTRVLVMMNDLGATPAIELYGLYGLVHERLRARGAVVERSLVGDFLTSLDTHGVLLSVLVLDDELVELWDDPVHTTTLRWKA